MIPDIRERSREHLRAELADAAVDVFVERGFEAVTVEEVAREIGISRATFFRYFGSKEDAILVSTDATGEDSAALIRAAEGPAAADPWSLLRAGFEPRVLDAERSPEKLRSRLRLVVSIPTLRARLAERRAAQVALIEEALAARIGDAESARILAVCGYAAINDAWHAWADEDAPAFRTLVDDRFARIAGAGRLRVSAPL